MTAEFSNYSDRFEEIQMERHDGILHLRFHTKERPFSWSACAHRNWAEAFRTVDADPKNRVILMSGTGEDFCGELDMESFIESGAGWDVISWEGQRLVAALLDLSVPVIAAVRGRCTIHAEIPLLSDIVLASPDAIFGDEAHFGRGVVPGDGAHILWPALLGPNRGRAFLLAEKTLTAAEALDAGVVAEVVASPILLERAWELAARIAAKPAAVVRNSRAALIRPLRRAFDDALALGFALQGSARLPGMKD